MLNKSKKYLVAKLWGWKCGYCRTRVAFYPDRFKGTEKAHIDHIIPKKLGGSDCYCNLVLACQTCNLGKSDRDMSKHPLTIEIKEMMKEYCECNKLKEVL